jgi:excisionase family DNA binding protein
MTNDHQYPKYVNAYELADFLRVRAATVRRWAQDGTIPSLRLAGRLLRFDLEEVERTLRDRALRTKRVRR